MYFVFCNYYKIPVNSCEIYLWNLHHVWFYICFENFNLFREFYKQFVYIFYVYFDF